jgi:3-hydroxyacyl-CoA dehydrogenase
MADPDDSNSKQTLDFESFEYRDFNNEKPAVALAAELSGDFTLLLANAVDDAMKLGYNWLQGPLEMIDAIGVDNFIARLEKEGRDVPSFVRTAAGKSFYRVAGGHLQYLSADGSYVNLERADGITRFTETRKTLTPIMKNTVASYYELPNRLGLVEWHSKANTLDGESMDLLERAVRHASENFQGLIIHNDAQHFSCGVNLEAVLGFIRNTDWDGLDQFLDHFQRTVLSMRYAPIPVVAAPSGLSLGGGFEVVLHADKVVFHANSVTGLVESLVGVVPGGGGVKETLYRWVEREGDVGKGAWQAFMNVGYGKTAKSPLEAEPLAMFREGIDSYVMNRDRLLDTAIKTTLAMVDGYKVVKRDPLAMAGRDACGEMRAWLEKTAAKGYLSPHDVTTGGQIAMIVTGGDVDAGTIMSEEDICGLERKAFLTLAKTPETRARIEHMLGHGSPLRN